MPRILSCPDSCDPTGWREHRFGLPLERWHALDNRAVWITGAGTGFGQSLAVALAAAGCRLFLTGRRQAKLEETLEIITGFGIAANRCLLVPADLTAADDLMAAVAMVRRRCRHLYGLINNAALPQPWHGVQALQHTDPTEWAALLATNLTAPWRLTREILPLMTRGPALRLLFISSEAGWAFTPGFGPYNVTKAALNTLAGSFAAEIAASTPACDSQVNTIIPGEARTEMNQGANDSPYTVVPLALALLSHPSGGPTGRFFHRDGRSFPFCYAPAYNRKLLD